MKSISIKNFKAFSNELKITLNKKNFLLYGENGAGKSSIYQALKIIFFKERLSNQIKIAATSEEQEQINNDFWSKYNNTVSNINHTITFNQNVYKRSDFQVFMISSEELNLLDKISLKDLLANFYLDIDNLDDFCLQKYNEIETQVNLSLESFQEIVKIEIDIEDDFSLKIIDPIKNIERKLELKKYFNEAKLNLVTLLVIFNAVKLSQIQEKNKILVLDDFITSLDSSNRTFLGKYLVEKFSNFQILLFTHNVSFYNLIMYILKEINKEANWEFGNIYEINNKSKLYIKRSILKVAEIEEEYKNTQDIEVIGNKIRQKFEVLLYEFSKLLMVGTVEDSKKIIERITKGKYIYYKNKSKTAPDLVDEVISILDEENDNNLTGRIYEKINAYKNDSFENLKTIVKDLKLYQKVTMHPMSHGTVGLTPFTTNEIKESINLLYKFEKNLKNLVDNDIITI